MSEQTEVSAETALGKFRIAGKDMGSVMPIATLLIVLFLAFMGYQQLGVLREMTQAVREQNCLISIPEAQREAKADFCKRITK